MKVAHFHFGKEGGAERFFVHLVNSFHERGLEQVSVIRPNRLWRNEIADASKIIESNFRNLSADRILLPLKVKQLANDWAPNALFAWMPRACRLMPNYKKCIRIARLGDYPIHLKYFKNIDVLVCNTPGIVEHVRNLGWTRGVEMISNFTYAAPATPVSRADVDTPEDAFVVSTMGRFVARKGFDVLIKAMSLNPNIYLWIAGDGEEADNLKNLARSLGVTDRIRFLGWKANPNNYVAASNVFAAASSHEPLGNIVLEAWAQNVPVVSTLSEGPKWFMSHEEDGLMVEIGDADGFANAFERLRTEQGLGSKLSQGSKKTLEEKFSKRVITDAYIDLFKRQP